MTGTRIIGGGILAGAIFYALSLTVWALFKFLPIVPVAIAVPPEGLRALWPAVHLFVSLFVGLMWALGYAVYGRVRPGGWLYGGTIYLVGLLPTFVAHFVVSAPFRSVVVYGAIVSLIGALLGGKVIEMVGKK